MPMQYTEIFEVVKIEKVADAFVAISDGASMQLFANAPIHIQPSI